MANNPTFGLPSPTLPITDPKTGVIASVWYQFLTRLQQLTPERAIAPITVGASPYTYTASTIGSLLITGGTVSTVVLTRGGVSVTTRSTIFIPMAAGDTVTVTYSVLPTITFVPSARA
jgi:hypothetical protein